MINQKEARGEKNSCLESARKKKQRNQQKRITENTIRSLYEMQTQAVPLEQCVINLADADKAVVCPLASGVWHRRYQQHHANSFSQYFSVWQGIPASDDQSRVPRYPFRECFGKPDGQLLGQNFRQRRGIADGSGRLGVFAVRGAYCQRRHLHLLW